MIDRLFEFIHLFTLLYYNDIFAVIGIIIRILLKLKFQTFNPFNFAKVFLEFDI